MEQRDMKAQASTIVAPDGTPARKKTDRNCPQCGAPPERRRVNCGFGVFPQRHDVCGRCGHDFEELTCE